jgi:hypothetical protein
MAERLALLELMDEIFYSSTFLYLSSGVCHNLKLVAMLAIKLVS